MVWVNAQRIRKLLDSLVMSTLPHPGTRERHTPTHTHGRYTTHQLVQRRAQVGVAHSCGGCAWGKLEGFDVVSHSSLQRGKGETNELHWPHCIHGVERTA